jgi:hypothetical protein
MVKSKKEHDNKTTNANTHERTKERKTECMNGWIFAKEFVYLFLRTAQRIKIGRQEDNFCQITLAICNRAIMSPVLFIRLALWRQKLSSNNSTFILPTREDVLAGTIPYVILRRAIWSPTDCCVGIVYHLAVCKVYWSILYHQLTTSEIHQLHSNAMINVIDIGPVFRSSAVSKRWLTICSLLNSIFCFIYNKISHINFNT